MTEEGNQAAKILRLGSGVVIAIGVISLMTAAYFTSGERLTRQTVPPNGGIVGPLRLDEPGTVLEVHVQQPQNARSGTTDVFGTSSTWSFVSGEVLDDEHEYLFGFGDELWAETGYDGSSWSEAKSSYDLKVTIPEAGTYFLGFETESPPNVQPSDVTVTIDRKRGSAIPHFVLGIGAVLLGLFLSLVASRAMRQAIGV